MKTVRYIASAFLVLLGSMLVVAWGLSQKSAESIENGTAGENLVVNVVQSPQTAEVIADGVVRALENQVDGQVGDLVLGLLDDQIHDLTEEAVKSEQFQSVLLTSADRAQNFFLAELSDPSREPAPFGIYLDPGERLNSRLDEVPVVGPFIPELEIDPVEVEIIPADTFEDIRTAYSALVWAATWFIWIGIAFIAAGIAIAPRWKRFLPRALVGAGILGLAVAFTLNFFGPSTIASFVPGGSAGGVGTLVEDVIADSALAPITNILLTLGLIALGLAIAFVLAVRYIPALGGRRDGDEDGHDHRGDLEPEPPVDTRELASVTPEQQARIDSGEQPPAVPPRTTRDG
ncbi:hypothetical protein [Demequina globuliformis]|uniref:hypothetical protein n=1 Tax=Demequina globuliformis TaxID=676202 RepID=UPI000783B975|nr:hypothetical protein [Demequina globuliformis]